MWSAHSFFGDAITILPTDPKLAQCGSSPYTFYIGVTGFTDTAFIITASFDDSSDLADGMVWFA